MTTPGRKVPFRLQVCLCAGLATGLDLAGCSGSAEPPAPPPPPTSVTVDPFEDLTAVSIEFLEPQTLTLVAGTPREVRVQVLPALEAGAHTVRFALIRQAEYAFLSADLVPTDAEGIARTTLTALSASSDFTLFAAVGRLQPEVLTVSTTEANLGTLILNPLYRLSGRRIVERWVASVHVGQTCAALLGPPFPDGEELTIGSGDSVQIDGVPAGTPLAAVIRAERFAGGCRSIGALKAGTNTIAEIDVIDRPLQLGELNLRLSLSVDATPQLNPGLDELAFRAIQPLNGTAANDLAALLDAMSDVSADSVSFEQARSEQDWVGVLVDALPPALPGTGLRTLIHDWMSSGLTQLSAPDAIVGTLGPPNAEGQASFTLGSVVGFAPAEAGFVPSNTALVSAQTDDLLRLGTTLSWQPTLFLAAAAERVAISESPGTRNSAPEGMAEAFDCANVARLLVNAGEAPGEAFPDCDEDCMLTLCDTAMELLWSRVTGSNLPSVPWQISGASQAQIDADARATSVEGNWIGSLTLSEFGDAPIQGPLIGRSNAN
ncbi:MAG: hypothetical protein ABI895_29030 [Deltaproteobacteria bacterium]